MARQANGIGQRIGPKLSPRKIGPGSPLETDCDGKPTRSGCFGVLNANFVGFVGHFIFGNQNFYL